MTIAGIFRTYEGSDRYADFLLRFTGKDDDLDISRRSEQPNFCVECLCLQIFHHSIVQQFII